jgi:plexin A
MRTVADRMIQCHVQIFHSQVAVGNLEFVLGQLEYQKFEPARSEYWVIGVAVGGGVLLTVVMVILIVYKRKSTHAQRQFRRLQQQLDSLESNIRNECKQGYCL